MAIIIHTKFKDPKIEAMALWPFLLIRKGIKKKELAALINHEKIHFAQQKEMLILPFYVWYAVEYLLLWIKYRDGDKAYRNICFEKEAYTNAQNLSYLSNRRFWAFCKYLKRV